MQSVRAFLRIPRHKQRTNLGADEVVGTAGAQVRQLRGFLRIDEAQHFRKIAETADQSPISGNPPAQEWKNIYGEIAAVG